MRTSSPAARRARALAAAGLPLLAASIAQAAPVVAGARVDATGGGTGPQASTCAFSLCDGFEKAAPGGPPDPTLWTVGGANCTGTGQAAIDASVAHKGAQSLKVTGMGGYCNHVFAATTMPAALGQKVFGRFFVRFADALGDGHVTFMAMKDGNDGPHDLRMGGQSRILMWNRESDDATVPVLSPAGIALSVAPTTGAWHCVEFAVNGPAGTMRTWLDGSQVPGLHVDATPTPDIDVQWLARGPWHPAPLDLRIGWESYAGQAMTLWFDDVVLGNRRIGCG